MIRYALSCAKGHAFESWFQSSAAFDKQNKRGLVSCPVCGSSEVGKAIMAPQLTRTREPESGQAEPPTPALPSPPAPAAAAPTPAATPDKAAVAMTPPNEGELRRKLKELRDHVTKNAHYVGARFPEEARKMHYGEVEHRSIYGEATPKEAKALHEEGIEFHPLPILPDDHN